MFFSFFLYQSPSSSFSFNPSTIEFVIGESKNHHKDWLNNYDGINRLGELCYNISISNDPTQMVKFPTWIPECFFFYLLRFSETSICSTVAFPPVRNSVLLFQFPLTLFQSQRCCLFSLHTLWLFLCWLGRFSWAFNRCFMGGYPLELSTYRMLSSNLWSKKL